MKTILVISVLVLFTTCSCNKGAEKEAPRLDFGVYEIIEKRNLTGSVIDSLKQSNLMFEKSNERPIVGYMKRSDSSVFQYDLSETSIQLVRTAYPVDKEGKYHAIVAVRPSPAIGLSDIHKTQAKDQSVEIFFNRHGAKKWAEFTAKNIGKQVAFAINGEIYSMPGIAAEIRSGRARIDGFENEEMAKKISQSFNGR